MKKENKEMLDKISKSLSQISDNEKLPESLTKNHIIELLENEQQENVVKIPSRKKKIISLVSSAAVFALIICSVFAIKTRENPTAVVPPPSVTQQPVENYGEVPLYDITSYALLEQKFMQYAKVANAQKIRGIYENLETADETAALNAEDNEIADGKGGGDVFGQTNIQIAGVDEADIIKNDGKYLYVVTDDFEITNDNTINSRIVKIIDTKNPEEMNVVSTIIPLEKEKAVYVHDLYIKNNKMIILCDINSLSTMADGTKYYGFETAQTMTVIYDITDKTKPVETGRFIQDGDLISSRMINNRVYIFTNYNVNIYNEQSTVKANCVPKTAQNGVLERIDINNICCMKNTKATSYLVVCSVNFIGNELDAKTKAILGGGNEVYCTTSSLYIANSIDDKFFSDDIKQDFLGKTELFGFLLNEGNAEFKSYGSVAGTVLNQFSMDEYNGNFRIATTVGFGEYNVVSVLNSKLEKIGEIKDIAPGETIYAVRFIGDKGYVVTFKQTDPLFVIDLSVPKSPKIAGELKIPGYSSYLHPVDENYIIGIGQYRDENGMSDKVETKISLFDISDPNNPREIDKLLLDGYSPAEYNHKALLEIKNGIYAIPLSNTETINGEVKTVDRVVTFSAFYGRLGIVGKYISDYSNLTINNARGDKIRCNNVINRSTFTEDALFAIGDYYIEAYSMSSGKKLSDIMINSYEKQYSQSEIIK